MEKIPYTLQLLLPTLSPAARIVIYEEGRQMEPIFKGQVIKAADNKQLLEREIKHIGLCEVQKAIPMLEIFVYE